MVRQWVRPLFALSLVGGMAPCARAGAQVRETVASVQLTAIMGSSVTFAAVAGDAIRASGGPPATPSYGMVVNVPYRVEVVRLRAPADSPEAHTPVSIRGSDGIHRELSPGARVPLIDFGQPGRVPVESLRDALHEAGLESGGTPITVDVVLSAVL